MKAILFYCEECDQLVPRGDAEYINGEWQCPRHDQRDSEQAQLVTDGGHDSRSSDAFLEWLNERIEDSRESYKRDSNDRHTSISLGKLRAYNYVRTEYLEREFESSTDQEDTDA